MKTENLEALLLTIEKGSISAAAEMLNYTPSAVSREIRSLEKELEMPLLTRSKAGVSVTQAGALLLPEIRRLVRDAHMLRENALQIEEGISGTVRLGVCYPAFYPWVSMVMAEYRAQYPGMRYIVKNGFSSALMEQVRQQEIDFCLISRVDDTCGWIPLLEDELVAILPPDHPFADRERVPITLLAEGPYLELHSNMGTETDNSRALRAAGIQPRNVLPVDDSSALYPMVEAGLGIGMENRINTLGREGNFVIRQIDPPQIVPLGIAFREDMIPAARRFVEYLAEAKETLHKAVQL